MSSEVPQIFDRAALRRNRRRAAAGLGDYDFLLRRAADDLADRILVQNRQFDRVLCLGSSSGYLRRALGERGALGTKIGTLWDADLTAAMLPESGGLVVDEECLPLKPAGLDLIISFWGLHHVNDLPGALVQMRAALKPNGLFLAALPGNDNLSALRRAFLQAESDILGGAQPHIHPFADLRDLAGLMQRAGFALPVADSDIIDVRYAAPLTLLRDLRGMGESNILTQRPRAPLRRDVLTSALTAFQKDNQDGDKTVAQFEICYLAGFSSTGESGQARLEGEPITLFDETVITGEKPSR